MLRSDLVELDINQLCALLAKVTHHRKQAEHFKDQLAIDNATWLINQVDRELRSR